MGQISTITRLVAEVLLQTKKPGHLAEPFYVNMELTPAESKFCRIEGSYLGTT